MSDQISKKPSDIVNSNVKDLLAWASDRETSKGLTEVVFCPKELKKGEVTDYISEARGMLEAYERTRYKDVTHFIL